LQLVGYFRKLYHDARKQEYHVYYELVFPCGCRYSVQASASILPSTMSGRLTL